MDWLVPQVMSVVALGVSAVATVVTLVQGYRNEQRHREYAQRVALLARDETWLRWAARNADALTEQDLQRLDRVRRQHSDAELG